MRSSRRRFRTAATIVAVLSVVGGFTGSPALDKQSCVQPQPIVGFGVQSHFALHYNLFIPEFERACPKALGLVSYYTGNDAAILNRAASRGADVANSVFDSFWDRDVSFTPAEKTIVEAGAGNPLGDGSNLTPKYSSIGQFPIYVDGLAVAYNLPCYRKPLSLSSLNLSLIYQGSPEGSGESVLPGLGITTWDDARLTAQNPGIDSACAGKAIKLTARADSTGATLVFKSLLARRNPTFLAYGQPQLNTAWPATIVCRGGGDRGSAGCVTANSGSIGYVSMSRAQKSRLQVAKIERLTADAAEPGVPTTDYIAPSSQGCRQAAEALVFPPGFDVYTDWSQISLVDSHAGYPLCFFNFIDTPQNYLSAYGDLMPEPVARTMRDYLQTIIGKRVQDRLSAFGLGSLPPNIIALDQDGIDKLSGCNLPSNGPLNDLHNGDYCSYTPLNPPVAR